MASPAFGQLIGPNVPATIGTPIQNEPQVAAFGNTLVAVWYRAVFLRYSGWGLSLDGGDTWIDGGGFSIVDPSRETTGGQSTICVDQTGRFYAATAYTEIGWGIALYRGTPQGGSLSWEGPFFAVPPTLTPGFDLRRALDAVRLTCDPERAYLYLSYTRSQAVAAGEHQNTIQFVRSLDGGTTWSAPQVLSSGIASNGSRPAVGPNGELYVVWEDFATRQVVGRSSADFGASFGPPFVVGEIRDNLGTLPPAWSGPFWRVNPAVSPPQFDVASDFPSLAVDRSDGPHRGRIYATWTDYAEGVVGPWTGQRPELEPNDWFATATEVTIGQNLVGFVMSLDLAPADRDLYTFMGTAGTTIHVSGQVTDVFPTPNEPVWWHYSLRCGQDTLQLTTVSENLVPWLYPPHPPPTLYTLPVDGRYYLGVGSGMRSYGYELWLRAMSPLPGQAAQDHRDIVLTSSDDGGATWAPKRRVGDAPPHYDESFPAVAVDDLGRVHLAWYDRRDDPGCGELVNTYWTFSVDGGESFVPARRLSTQASSWDFINPRGDSNIGDHLGLTTEGGQVHVLWSDTRGADADIYALRIDDVPTGIAVPRFIAEAADGYIRLAWTVADPTGITGFRLHRAEGDGEFFEAIEAEPRPSRGAGEYQAEDRSVIPGRSYRYRLEVVREGTSGWEGPVPVTIPAPIVRLAWQAASPNPFSRSVSLALAVPRAGEAWVRVYDLTGHEVATLHRGAVSPGVKTLTWEGMGQAARPAAAGVYLLRADLAGESTTRRVVLIR
jgi:flagellar hook capping protein FlgD